MAGQPASVRFRGVSKRFGPVVAVNDVTFLVEPGTLVTLLGPSGCGKTTTLRLIAGLEMASEGQVFIGERDVTLLPATERDVSMVFQSYALFPHMTVAENCAYGLIALGRKRQAAHAAAREKLAQVGLAGLDDRLPSELSGGQQQRVAVARALVLEPQVLLFDEPLSNLDAKLRRRVREEIRELQQSLRLTVVYVTHDQQEALAVSDKVIVMDNAVIAQEGTPRDLYERPASRFVASFIGEANLVHGRLRRRNDSQAVVALGDLEIKLPHRGAADGEVLVALRPEALRLETLPPRTPHLSGAVRKTAYLGDRMEYTVETTIGELFVIDSAVARPVPAGATVYLTPARHGIAVVPK
jgi:iron(III) transport system ATP-binding protein